MSYDITANIKKNGQTTYTARVRKNGVAKTATFKRKSDCNEWAIMTEQKILESIHLPHRMIEEEKPIENHTLIEAIERYKKTVLIHKAKATQIAATQIGETCHLNHWINSLGKDLDISKITPAHLNQKRDQIL